MDGIDVLGDSLKVVDDVTEVGGEDELGDLVTEAGELLISRLESSLALGRKIEDQDRLVNLDSLGTGSLELGEELLIDGQKAVEEINGVESLVTIGLAQVKEAHGADEDRASCDTGLLGLVEVGDDLGGLGELESLVLEESRLDIVVVGVKPLDHLQAGHVNAALLVATAHSEVLVNGVEAILGIALGNSLFDVVVSYVSICEEIVEGKREDVHQSPGCGSERDRRGRSHRWG